MNLRHIRHAFFTLTLLIAAALWPKGMILANEVHESPKVVVSIPPFHALVAGVMEGVGSPTLLVKTGASPHDYSLRPSDVKQLFAADIIFWGGPELETFLIKPLQNIKSSTSPSSLIRQVPLVESPGLLLLPIRSSPAFEPHNHTHEAHEHKQKHEHEHLAHTDMHFWLDPHNAKLLVDEIVRRLSIVDPTHAKIYQQNGNKEKIELDKLDLDIQNKLKRVKKIPYIVFHDAYQYFEHRYGLNGVGAITLNPEIPPSSKRLKTIQETIQKTNAHCVFSEPQFRPKLVESLVKGTSVKIGELDPLGKENSEGGQGYIKLLEGLSNALSDCLSNHQ